MKEEIGLIGGGFQHSTSSTLDKIPKYVQWKYNSLNHDKVVFVDNAIINGIRDNKKYNKKVAWLLESRSIISNLMNYVLNNKNQLLDSFDLIFTHDKRLLDYDEKFVWVPAYGTYIDDIKIYDKNKLVSMISSNKTITTQHRTRISWVNKLKNKLDLFGRGFNEIDKKEEGLCDYMFSVAIENDSYDYYFTEKIIDCFATGTIPIYMGCPNLSKHFNMDGVIRLTDDFNINSLTKEFYLSKMDAIKDNLNRIKELEILDDYLYLKYLKT